MMNEFEAQVLSDLSVLKTQMMGLVGMGLRGGFMSWSGGWRGMS
jgi:hypothetical protein